MSGSAESPRVSVLMPVYNAEPYLAEAVESILGQTFPDFELLAVNDGSTDGSLDTLRRFEARDARVRVISRPNTGYLVALNEMLGVARGEYVARMDADDVSLRDRLQRQVRALDSDPGLACVGGACEMIDAAGRRLVDLSMPVRDEEIQRACLEGHTAICHPAATMRRAHVQAVGGYDPAMYTAEDLDLWLKLGERGRLANLPEVVLRYRLHPGSVSEQRRGEQRDTMRRACENAWRRRGVRGEFTASNPWRPGPDRTSRHQFALKYGWWAFQSGERGTAVRYGARAIASLPAKPEGWKLLVCAAIKPLPSKRLARAE